MMEADEAYARHLAAAEASSNEMAAMPLAGGTCVHPRAHVGVNTSALKCVSLVWRWYRLE